MVLFDYLVAFVPMLSILIVVHELGHFVVAKACGVRVLKFAVGFGSPIGFGRFRLRWERGGTEYVIGWFPLGGFVRMLGEYSPAGEDESATQIPADARPDEFLDAKPVWQKLAIVFAGPSANLLLPVAIFAGMLWFGIPKALPVVGMVEAESPAAEAGVMPGDRIVAIDGEPLKWWDELAEQVYQSPNQSLRLDIERDDERLELTIAIASRARLDPFGTVEQAGWAGLGSRRLPALVGVPTADSVGASSGLRSGDRIVSIDGQDIVTWGELVAANRAAGGETAIWSILRAPEKPEGEPIKAEAILPTGLGLEALGLVPATILVSSVSEDLPAAAAGLEPGDLIVSVDGKPVGSFHSFQNIVRTSGGRSLSITYARGGELATVEIAPKEGKVKGPLGIDGMEETVYLIGIHHRYVPTRPGESGVDIERNPIVSLPRAVGMTVDMSVRFLEGLGKLFTGQVGTDKLSGPIGIAEIARKSLDIGFQAYMYTLILISINLGILNLLPIPILDGGQVLIYSIEGIKRAPISLRSREIVTQIGFMMLVFLMALAFWNDLSRKWEAFVEWLSAL